MLKRPIYTEAPTDSSSGTESSPTTDEDDEQDFFAAARPKASARPRRGAAPGRLAQDGALVAGTIMLGQLSAPGTAIKIVLDEWMGVWEDSPEVAALQLLNMVLCLADIDRGLDRAELEHHDPAACLSALQDEWQSAVRGPAEGLLNPRNRSKTAKTVRANFADFWSRWAALIGGGSSALDPELASKYVLGWLMTMSSSGYRPLRHAAALACFDITRGCCQACSGLARELDQAARLAASANGAGLVDQVSAQLAALEKAIQMTFDGVFVQRFRDIDPTIRTEAVESLARWVLAYPDVFLDNSYLRYAGWALSDRAPVVRLAVLEALAELYRDGSAAREGMASLLHRFLPRIVQMAERDVDMDVRNAACTLLSTLYRLALDQEERDDLSAQLSFVPDLLRFLQPLTKESLALLGRFIFRGRSPEEFQALAEAARQKIAKPSLSSDQTDIAIIHHVALFLEDTLGSVPPDRRALCVEHFVHHAKRTLPILRNLPLWLVYLQHVVLPGGGHAKARGKDRDEWNLLLFAKHCSPAVTLHAIQAIARYSFVFVNSPADASRQMVPVECGGSKKSGSVTATAMMINSTTSQDLVGLIAPFLLHNWSRVEAVSDGDLLAPLLDLIALAKAGPLLEAWPAATACISALTSACTDEPSAMALVRLLHYWATEHVEGGISAALSQMILGDSQRLGSAANTPIASVAWTDLIRDGCWARLAAISALLPLPDAAGIISTVGRLLERLDVRLGEQNSSAADSTTRVLEESVVPALLRILANIVLVTDAKDCSDLCIATLRAFPRAKEVRLELYCQIAAERPGLLYISQAEEASFLQDGDAAPTPTVLFGLGRLYLLGAASEQALLAVFRRFQPSGLLGKCYSQLWELVCIKQRDTTAASIKAILKDQLIQLAADNQNEETTAGQAAIANTAALATMMDSALKRHPEAHNAQQWVELHVECARDCQRVTPPSVGQAFMNQILAVFAHHLAPNIAIEVLATIKRELAASRPDDLPPVEATTYLRALDRACNARRTAPPQRRVPQPATAGAASRLRQEAVLADSHEDDAQGDEMYAGVGEAQTPIRELEGLRMSSELTLPSSPLQPRKRLLRP